MAVDSSGNYIVADNLLHRIVKVTPAGVITQIANYPVSNPDGPESVYVRIDSAGNYIVADDHGGVVSVYQITTSGNETDLTITGTNPGDIAGLALDSTGNYWVSVPVPAVIDQINPAGVGSVLYANGNQTLVSARGMYRDPSSGNILITDQSLGTLYSLTPNGVTLTQIDSGLGGALAVLITSASQVTPLSITTTGLPSGTQGSVYSTSLAASGGSRNRTWYRDGVTAGTCAIRGGYSFRYADSVRFFHCSGYCYRCLEHQCYGQRRISQCL